MNYYPTLKKSGLRVSVEDCRKAIGWEKDLSFKKSGNVAPKSQKIPRYCGACGFCTGMRKKASR